MLTPVNGTDGGAGGVDYMTLCGIRQLRKCDDMWYSIVHGERTLCGIGN